ncbi:prolyl oligopeptidase family serine peptidase [Rhizobium sp. PAMB 3174]
MTYLEFENDSAPATLAFVDRMNDAADAALRTPGFERDRDLIRALIERDDKLIIPARRGDYLYQFRRLKTHALGVLQRVPKETAPLPDADWETVFDLDAFCETEGKTWVWRGATACIDDPDLILLALSDGGSDLMRYVEFDCRDKAVVAGGFDTPACRAHASWLNRDEIFYFGSIDRNSATRSSWPRVGRILQRGMVPADAPVIFEAGEDDVTAFAFRLGHSLAALPASAGHIDVFAIRHDIGSTSYWLQKNGGERMALDVPRLSDVGFSHNYYLWRAKSDEAVAEGSLVLAPLPVHFDACPPRLDRPRIVFAPGERQTVTQFMLLKEWCVFTVSDNLQPKIFLLDLSDPTGEPQELAMPANAETIGLKTLDDDLHHGDDTLLIWTQGFLQPPTLFRLDLADRSQPPTLVKTAQAPELFDATGMRSELLMATSSDGTEIPYRLVLPANAAATSLPVLLYGYGGFESGLQPYYSGVTGLWLSQGNAYVQAYIRGGDEYGPAWHLAAKREKRPTAYEDFVAIARDLVKRGYARPDTIACQGGSNGGLLTGVMLTRYPEDFGAVWCQVPVLDMLRFHTFPAGRAWIDEYGDPDKPEDATFLKAYSPLHNILSAEERRYPPVYVESSSNDDRVHPSHARRFAALLKDAGQSVLFREFGSGGHGGDGRADDIAARLATGYSFLRETIVRNARMR